VTWREAMQDLEASGLDFTDFDADNDRYLDSLGIVHSGKSNDCRTLARNRCKSGF